jgi:hypothetical protein
MARLYAGAPDDEARRRILEQMGCPPAVIGGSSPLR